MATNVFYPEIVGNAIASQKTVISVVTDARTSHLLYRTSRLVLLREAIAAYVFRESYETRKDRKCRAFEQVAELPLCFLMFNFKSQNVIYIW
jgi:hypothetical protein